ncbi:MAG: HK97 family phage prohead protease, partial [Caldisericia bacterium]|nr:HK97 family phage prohead protease [Caldisericia bacterium]
MIEEQKKFIKLEAQNPIQKENGYVEFEYIISGSKRDRQGEILDPKGAKTENFLKNPTLLWGHNQTMGTEPLPIGSVEEVKVYDDKISCRAIIHNITQLAREVGEMVKKGFLNTMSVGFIPLERDKSDSSVITEWEMLEHSIVPIPAYQDALIYARSKGYNEVVKMIEAEVKEDEKLEKIEDEIAIKPYENEFSCRLKDPALFQEGSFRRGERSHNGKKYSVIYGKLKGKTTLTEQAYRYPKDTWSEEEASSHCKEHKGSFEKEMHCDVCEEKQKDEKQIE